MLLYGRNQYHIVKQLSSKLKVDLKEDTEVKEKC